MPQYLRIAEKIYSYMEKEMYFLEPLQDRLNSIVKRLREELKDTDLKLMYNYIDFVEGFIEKPHDDRISIDISLIPSHKNKDEFILWLAGFIDSITEGGVKKIPPLLEDVPPDFTFNGQLKSILGKTIQTNTSADLITQYFQSEEFNKS